MAIAMEKIRMWRMVKRSLFIVWWVKRHGLLMRQSLWESENNV